MELVWAGSFPSWWHNFTASSSFSVEQFQTDEFDARKGKLCLFAMAVELRFILDRERPAASAVPE
jgi:hypothetical protein